jgi:hypothetical protein
VATASEANTAELRMRAGEITHALVLGALVRLHERGRGVGDAWALRSKSCRSLEDMLVLKAPRAKNRRRSARSRG